MSGSNLFQQNIKTDLKKVLLYSSGFIGMMAGSLHNISKSVYVPYGLHFMLTLMIITWIAFSISVIRSQDAEALFYIKIASIIMIILFTLTFLDRMYIDNLLFFSSLVLIIITLLYSLVLGIHNLYHKSVNMKNNK